jgi:uncharacterized protein YndB with AHSA1/START domain
VSHELRVERVIEASAAVVFDAFTDADAQRVWMRDTDDDPDAILETRCDLRVGGTWVVAWGPSRDELYRETNVFQVVDRPRRLVMATTSTTPDGDRLDTTVEVTFEDHDGKTRMTVVQRGFPTAEIRDYFAATAWQGVLDALDRFVRGQAAGSPKGERA